MPSIYIAGPMTGYAELNYPAFHSAAETLRRMGFEVVSPAELNPITEGYREAMRKDINGHTARLKLEAGQAITMLHVAL